MPTYIVGFRDATLGEPDGLLITTAPSREHALAIFARRSAVNDSLFFEHVHTCSINMSFAEQFWIVTRAEKSALHEGRGAIAADQTVARRIKKFFGPDHAEWAKMFISHWDFCVKTDADVLLMAKFPDDMLVYIFVNTWLDDVVALEITEIPQNEEKIPAESDIHAKQPSVPEDLSRTCH